MEPDSRPWIRSFRVAAAPWPTPRHGAILVQARPGKPAAALSLPPLSGMISFTPNIPSLAQVIVEIAPPVNGQFALPKSVYPRTSGATARSPLFPVKLPPFAENRVHVPADSRYFAISFMNAVADRENGKGGAMTTAMPEIGMDIAIGWESDLLELIKLETENLLARFRTPERESNSCWLGGMHAPFSMFE